MSFISLSKHHTRNPIFRLLAGLSIIACQLGFPAIAVSQDDDPSEPPAQSVFDAPARQAEYSRLKQSLSFLLNQKKWSDAEQAINRLLEFTPWDPVLYYQLVRVHTVRGDNDAALDSLARAIELGLTDTRIIEQDPLLAVLRLTNRYPELLKQARKAAENVDPILPESTVPAKLSNGVAQLSAENTFYDFRLGLFRSLFEEPTSDSFADPAKTKPRDETAEWLNTKIGSGEANGYLGYFYDNRDAGHSSLDTTEFPLLARITYGPEAVRRELHNGPQFRFLYNRITIGNSSTAVTGGAFWRSHPRFAYANQKLTAVLAAQYGSNQLYLYPEHLDHDPEYGDLFPANTPYVLISQGSSGSDQAFLKALFEAMGALKPEVKDKLAQSGALMPALQMLFRYSNKGIQGDEAYLSGKAHPSVFDSANLDRDYLVRSAHALTTDELPPVVRLSVEANETAMSGPDYFSPRSEVLFNTSQSIARVFRGMKFDRTMVVSAAKSVDLNGLSLTYRWVLLRGDSDLVKITPSADGTAAEITVCHHNKRPISTDESLMSSRVDIGVFAHNGTHYSAPAFVTYYFLDHEKRSYDESNRILSVDYRSGDKPPYIDPMIDGIRNWIDEYHYSEEVPSRLTGWTRTHPDGTTQEFAPEGVLIADGSARGKINTVKGVRYLEQQASPELPPTIQMESTENTISYDEYLNRLEKAKASGKVR